MSTALDDRLREAFAHRANSTDVRVDLVRPGEAGTARSDVIVAVDARGADRWSPRRRSIVAVGAVAAVVGLVATGVAVSQRGGPVTDEPGSDIGVGATTATTNGTIADASADVVLTDRAALDLEQYRVLPVVRSTPLTFTVLDDSALPAGWSFEVMRSFTLLGPSDGSFPGTGGYSSGGTLTDDGGTSYELTVSSEDFLAVGATVDDTRTVGGAPVLVADGVAGEIGWTPADGVHVMLGNADADVGRLVDVAEQLTFVSTDELPLAPRPTGAGAPDAGAAFAGRIAGETWSATVGADALRSMFVDIGGQRLGGFANDRLSQPTDVPVVTGEATITALPGVGAVAFGYSTPSATAVVATLAGGATVSFPTLQRDLEAFWAVPIPTGVTVVSLAFVGATGVIATLTVPPLDPQLGGSYGGVFG